MQDHFYGCRTEAEIKARYRDLAKRHHPDLGGDVAAMQAVNAAYESILKGAYRAAGWDDQKVEDRWEMDKEVMEKAAELLAVPGIAVELCGVWLWVTGETRTVRGILKLAGCRWAPKKSAWYWRREVDAVRWRGKRRLSMNEIRVKYGTRTVDGQARGWDRDRETATAGAMIA